MTTVLSSPGAQVSLRIRHRTVVVCLGLVVANLALFLLALCSGSISLSVPEALMSLIGHGDHRTDLIVLEWRLPRVLAALTFGAALGASGALFQSLTRNPLGSPDVLGFDTGAVTGALVAILVLGSGQGGVTSGALIGGLSAAAVVAALGLSRHGEGSTRLIVIGIGVSAVLLAVNQLLILRASLEDAMRASSWTLGNLGAVGWRTLVPVMWILAALLLAAIVLGPAARMMEMHGEASIALGVSLRRTQVLVLIVGVALTAVPVSVSGPIAFVALTAPHLARGLTRVNHLTILPAALMGSLLLLAADVTVIRLPTPSTLPVSIATLVLGGVYFVWLLLKEGRRFRP